MTSLPLAKVPPACDVKTAPPEATLFHNTVNYHNQNEWRKSTHPWCIACDLYYHDVCMTLSSLLDVPPKETKNMKLTDLAQMFVTFEKLRLIFYQMMFGNPLVNDLYNFVKYMEFHKTIFLTIENICVQLILCITERVKHHNTCILPPQNDPHTKYGNFGDTKHTYILALYAAELFSFLPLYELWLDMINTRIKAFGMISGVKRQVAHSYVYTNIFETQYNNEIVMLRMIMCAAFPTKQELISYIAKRKQILATEFTVIPHNDLMKHIHVHLYTQDCETFPSQMNADDAYKKCRNTIIKNINKLPSFVTDVSLKQFEVHLEYLVDEWDRYCDTSNTNITSSMTSDREYVYEEALPQPQQPLVTPSTTTRPRRVVIKKTTRLSRHDQDKKHRTGSRTHESFRDHYITQAKNAKLTQKQAKQTRTFKHRPSQIPP